jgi:hypothetical protein
MRSDQQLDREVKNLADLINSQLVGTYQLRTPETNAAARIALGIYSAVRWSRGRRELAPSEFVRKLFAETEHRLKHEPLGRK